MGIIGFLLVLIIITAVILPFLLFKTTQQASKFLLVNFIIACIYISIIIILHYQNDDNYRGIGTAIYGFICICSHIVFMIFYSISKGIEAHGEINRNLKSSGTEEFVEPKIHDFKQSLAMSLTRIEVSKILLSYYDLNQPLTNVEIMNLSKLKSSKLIIDFLKELEILELLENKRTKNSATWKLNKQGESLLKEVIRVL